MSSSSASDATHHAIIICRHTPRNHHLPPRTTQSSSAATHHAIIICRHAPRNRHLPPRTTQSSSAATHHAIIICRHAPHDHHLPPRTARSSSAATHHATIICRHAPRNRHLPPRTTQSSSAATHHAIIICRHTLWRDGVGTAGQHRCYHNWRLDGATTSSHKSTRAAQGGFASQIIYQVSVADWLVEIYMANLHRRHRFPSLSSHLLAPLRPTNHLIRSSLMLIIHRQGQTSK